MAGHPCVFGEFAAQVCGLESKVGLPGTLPFGEESKAVLLSISSRARGRINYNIDSRDAA
jgi:hypothetical protein